MNTSGKQTSNMAIISLVSGILSWTLLPFFLPAVVAIITGHMARKEIRLNEATKEGDGLALTGLILGWVNILIWVLAILFFGGLILAALGFGIAASNGG